MEHRCFCPWSIIIFILQKSILVFNGQKNSATELDFCKVNQSFYWSKPLPSQGKKIKFWFQLVDKNTWLCFLKNIPQNFICTMNSFGCFLFRNWNSFRFLNRRSLFKRASEFFKSLTYLLKDIFNIFCKKNPVTWMVCLHLFSYIFSQIVLVINTYCFFRTRNFMNKKLRNVSLCKKQLPICHLYTLKKQHTNT